nr:pentatricopeptide repeat-containing protein, mitochondrial [Quercus suber]
MHAARVITVVHRHFYLSNCSYLKFHCPCFSTLILSKPNLHSASSHKTVKTSKFLVYCNTQITKHGKNGNIKEAESVFSHMPHKNTISWTAMLTAYGQSGQTVKARKLFDEMPERNTASYNAMITAYIRNKCVIEEAVKLFDEIPERNAISYAAMITGYVWAGMFDKAEKLYSDMPVKWRDPVCSNALINGYLKMGREGTVMVNSTTLTVLFDGCGSLGRFGCTDVATKIFHQMSRKDVVSWNSLIAGYVQCGSIEEAFILFEMMPRKDVISWTTMITGFSSKGITEKCIQLFKLMPQKDDIAWTAVISGFVNNGEYEEAFCWFIDMLQKAVRPNPLTLSGVLSASAGLATLNQGLQIHAHIGLDVCYKFDEDLFIILFKLRILLDDNNCHYFKSPSECFSQAVLHHIWQLVLSSITALLLLMITPRRLQGHAKLISLVLGEIQTTSQSYPREFQIQNPSKP